MNYQVLKKILQKYCLVSSVLVITTIMLIIIRNSTFKRYKNDLIIRNTINFSYNSNELKNNNSSNKIIIMEEDSKRKYILFD